MRVAVFENAHVMFYTRVREIKRKRKGRKKDLFDKIYA